MGATYSCACAEQFMNTKVPEHLAVLSFLEPVASMTTDSGETSIMMHWEGQRSNDCGEQLCRP